MLLIQLLHHKPFGFPDFKTNFISLCVTWIHICDWAFDWTGKLTRLVSDCDDSHRLSFQGSELKLRCRSYERLEWRFPFFEDGLPIASITRPRLMPRTLCSIVLIQLHVWFLAIGLDHEWTFPVSSWDGFQTTSFPSFKIRVEMKKLREIKVKMHILFHFLLFMNLSWRFVSWVQRFDPASRLKLAIGFDRLTCLVRNCDDSWRLLFWVLELELRSMQKLEENIVKISILFKWFQIPTILRHELTSHKLCSKV